MPIETDGEGITRREALKRGAILGGALVWSAPVVQTIGMTPALASETSSVCCLSISLTIGGSVGPVTIRRSRPADWAMETCNCGTHPDETPPRIEIRIADPDTLWEAYNGGSSSPGGCRTLESSGLFSDTGLPNGEYEVYALISGQQGGTSCSATSNMVEVTVI